MTLNKGKSLNVVITGHVDHGKSTVLGRLLADTGSVPPSKIAQVRDICERTSKPFEYAFLIDALKDERAQGITIDSARVFFNTKNRHYIIIDAPGHIDFLRNMVTGASRAEAAFLVIDAAEGVKENSRRHGFLLSVLGIKQIVVLVNKMDRVSYDRKVFSSVVKEYTAFLKKVNIKPVMFIPVSGLNGENIVKRSPSMGWYDGDTVLEALENFSAEKEPYEKPFRMPVQDVYKFTRFGDDRRIVAGTVLTGRIREGDEIIFYPSFKTSTIKNIEAFSGPRRKEALAGEAVGFTLAEQVYVKRGEVAVRKDEPEPHVTSRVRVSIFWLGARPMTKDKTYIFKLGTARVEAKLLSIERVFDASDIDKDFSTGMLQKNKVAECVLGLSTPLAFDLVDDFQETSRFVIVDDFQICGGGIVRQTLKDQQGWVREKVFLRNNKWIKSNIPHDERVEKHRQESAVIFITGRKNSGRKLISKRLEERLFKEDRLVYYLGMGNVLYGVDADIKGSGNNREEHLRRLAEVAHIMLDAGMILIISAIELTSKDMDLVKTGIGPEDMVKVVWVGDKTTTDIGYDLKIKTSRNVEKAVDDIKKMMVESEMIH